MFRNAFLFISNNSFSRFHVSITEKTKEGKGSAGQKDVLGGKDKAVLLISIISYSIIKESC